MEYGGRLLYQDGWTCSAHDWHGPEWPPPREKEQLRQLKNAYWTERRRIVKSELDALLRLVQEVELYQASTKIPLRQILTGKGRRAESVPLDLSPLRDRIEWLIEDMANCDNNLVGEQNGKEQ